LQAQIDLLAAQLDVRPVAVGLLTNDGLNIFVDDSGLYHFTFYERGKVGFDRTGTLDDALYWFSQGEVSSLGRKLVGDRAQRFRYEHEVLSRLDPRWAKRRVRELAAMFRNGQPQDIALLPDIGEVL
jgi:hypothetical protein